MKTKLKLLAVGMLLMVGCNSRTPGNIPGIEIVTPKCYEDVWLTFATNGNERFAIAVTAHGSVSICQIKDDAK
jgi:hypothetical protein